MKRTLQKFAVFAGIFLFPAMVWSQGSVMTRPINAEERAALFPSRDLLSAGSRVAAKACSGCHGTDGTGSEPGIPHLAGQRTVYLYRVLQEYQSRDRKSDDMVHETGFLNREALLAVSAYYASLAPSSPATEETVVSVVETAGGDPFSDIRDDMKKCVKCHGESGNASGSGMPNLTAQSPEYFVEAMKAYADGERNHKVMARLASGLGPDALVQMGVFYAVQDSMRTTTSGDGDATAGQTIAEPCADCHGADGNASGIQMPTLAGQDARYFVKAMKAYQTGKRQHEKMASAVELLNETDLSNLAAFYAGQKPVGRDVHTPLTSTEWIARCERCHGIEGNSTDPRFPMLAGQDSQYLSRTLQAYQTSSRSNSTMHAMAAPLSESDVSSIVQYYGSRKPKSVIYLQLPCDESAE